MKKKGFAYQRFKGVAAWAVVEQAIESLVLNGDLVERTARRYLVGLLIKKLSDAGMLTTLAPQARDNEKGRKARARRLAKSKRETGL